MFFLKQYCCCFFKLTTAIKIVSILYFFKKIQNNENIINKIFCLAFGIIDLIVALLGIFSLLDFI